MVVSSGAPWSWSSMLGSRNSRWRALPTPLRPGVILGLSIGRIGCTVNGDSPGTATSLPWGFTYTHPDAFSPPWPTHPAAVYEILWNMVILMVLWRWWKRLSPDGSLFLVMLAAYSFGRFWISWMRDEPAVFGPLHQSHVISLLLFVIAVGLLAYRKARLVTRGRSRSLNRRHHRFESMTCPLEVVQFRGASSSLNLNLDTDGFDQIRKEPPPEPGAASDGNPGPGSGGCRHTPSAGGRLEPEPPPVSRLGPSGPGSGPGTGQPGPGDRRRGSLRAGPELRLRHRGHRRAEGR